MHNRINKNIRRLKDNIYNIPVEHLCHKPAPEKWSKKEILGHLIDSALNNLKRFLSILHYYRDYEVRPYDQDYLVAINQYQQANLAHLVTLWESLNHQIANIVRDIPIKKLEQEVMVDKDEKRTCQWLIEDYIDHMEHHLDQILSQGVQPMKYHVTREEALDLLKDSAPRPFVTLLHQGDLEVEYYKPRNEDKQQPHDKDELYIIASGSADFVREGEHYQVKAHDILFVRARQEHRFENFSEDFATWVIFYGLKR